MSNTATLSICQTQINRDDAGPVKTTRDMTTAQAEEVVQAQAKTFLRMKPYLLERWQRRTR